MLNLFKLLLPALIPSWNFFDIIAPSPRIQFALLTCAEQDPKRWHEFRPRPARVALTTMLIRLFYNAAWNESLFMASCAERLMQHPTQPLAKHSEEEIIKRIKHHLTKNNSLVETNIATHLQFRLAFVQRHGSHLEQAVTYYSKIQPLEYQARIK